MSVLTSWIFVLVASTVVAGQSERTASGALAAVDEVMKSGADLWGEAAMRQANGLSYEFFQVLLPPPRYVNADFRFYPIVLGAPRARQKARLIANGSGVNL